MLQRKCACGGSAGMSGECEECQGKHLTINPYSADRRRRPASHRLTAGLCPRSTPLPDSGGGCSGPGAGHDFGQLRIGAAVLRRNERRARHQPTWRPERTWRLTAPQRMRRAPCHLRSLKREQEAPGSMDLSQTPTLIQREVADVNASEWKRRLRLRRTRDRRA